jgi:hypothetical protein
VRDLSGYVYRAERDGKNSIRDAGGSAPRDGTWLREKVIWGMKRRKAYKITDLHIIFLWYGIRVCNI